MEPGVIGQAGTKAIEGLKLAQEKAADAAEAIAGGSLEPEDIVSLSMAANGFKASVAVLKIDAEMTRSLLDIVA
jgi:hypothetical protein